ncbi:hypothetical protein ACIREO_23245 [Streptomyces sp. NPDC102441]|uniref:hypothetical protein n=1 Tax=Streptomyces sp. NPDC102441 TaxID=3366176 RepID=UPI00381970FD
MSTDAVALVAEAAWLLLIGLTVERCMLLAAQMQRRRHPLLRPQTCWNGSWSWEWSELTRRTTHMRAGSGV